MIITIITFVVVLCFLVIIHELGHFLAAKKFKAKVEEFGLGIQPKIYSKKIGETVYSINALPIGGFVKIKGEDDMSNEENKDLDPDNFNAKPIWQRALILSSGVAGNLIVGWIIFIVLFATSAPIQITEDIPRNYIKKSDLVISEVLPDSPAQKASLQAGDIILKIDNNKFESIDQFQQYVTEKNSQDINLLYKREKNEFSTTLKPEIINQIDKSRPIIGVGLEKVGIVRYPVNQALVMGTKTSWQYLSRIMQAFANIVKQIFVGKGVEGLGGPVAIAVATGNFVDMGLPYVLVFTAILSFNFAIINIFPFPALDGGRLIFLAIEKIMGRPSKKETEAYFHKIGFTLLIILLVVVTYRDFAKFGGQIWKSLIN